MFKWGMSLECKKFQICSFPPTFSEKFFNKATCQILVKKLMKEYLVQETEILNQLLGKWEKS